MATCGQEQSKGRCGVCRGGGDGWRVGALRSRVGNGGGVPVFPPPHSPLRAQGLRGIRAGLPSLFLRNCDMEIQRETEGQRQEVRESPREPSARCDARRPGPVGRLGQQRAASCVSRRTKVGTPAQRGVPRSHVHGRPGTPNPQPPGGCAGGRQVWMRAHYFLELVLSSFQLSLQAVLLTF